MPQRAKTTERQCIVFVLMLDHLDKMGFTEVPVTELLQILPDAPQVTQFATFDWWATEIA